MDATTIATIAGSAVSLLIPFLKKFAEDAASGAAKKAGSDAWEKAKRLYESIKARFSGESSAALSALEKSPDDADNQAAVRFQLKMLMAEDKQLATELANLIKEADDAGVDTVFNTNIHGEVEKFYQIGVIHGDAKFE